MKLNGNKYSAEMSETQFHGRGMPQPGVENISRRNGGGGNGRDYIGTATAAVSVKTATPPQTAELPLFLAAFGERVFLPADEFVYKAGDDIKYIYFPETAIMSELQILEGGETIEIAMLGKKEIVGLPAIFGSSQSPNWTMNFFAGSALRVSTDIIKQEFLRGGALQKSLLEATSRYINQISQRGVCNAHHCIEKRLCFWLMMLHDRSQSDDFLVTQEQLAYFLGVYRPSITQVAQTLRRENIIEYVRGKISIINRRKLEQTACFCYSNIDNCYKA